MTVGAATSDVDAFIGRWAASSGAERANFQSFANDLCDVLGVPRPNVSVHEAERNDYAFERKVEFKAPDGRKSFGRIDLYKKGSFVLEAKQSRWSGAEKAIAGQSDLFVPETVEAQLRRGGRSWDVLMSNAYSQAVEYTRALPRADVYPPFVLVCDVGYCLEIHADFTRQGKYYARFPDPQGYRVLLTELKNLQSASCFGSFGPIQISSIQRSSLPRSPAKSRNAWLTCRRASKRVATRLRTWRTF